MHCRMCSQRLPRPGRLCRECDQELSFARTRAKALDGLPTPGFDVEGVEPREAGRAARLPARPIVIAAAFAAGIAGAGAFYVGSGPPGASARQSVMIDRDLSLVTPRAVQPPRSPPPVRVAAAARAPAAYDRVLGLADALDGCARQSFFARLACEERARARYCEGTDGRIPECAGTPARGYRQ